MKTRTKSAVVWMAALVFATSAVSYGQEGQASVKVGEEAPEFELSDSEGNKYRLSDFRGKKSVVLEFFRSGSW